LKARGRRVRTQSFISIKRSYAIRKGLINALDLLVICAGAGLTVDAACQRVAREPGRACPNSATNSR
jgi:tight adherence protein C